MNIKLAKSIIVESLTNLEQRRGVLTLADVEAEVINNACLFYLKKQRDSTSYASSIEESFTGYLNSTQNLVPIIKAFIDVACQLFPDNYGEKEAAAAIVGIQQNVVWEGMWDYLRDYFESNHGRKIDNTETTTTIFYSNRHCRFVDNNMVSESEVERTININLIEDDEVIVAIAPTLSPKKAYLVATNDRVKTFKGYDPDYLFKVNFDEFEEVLRFTLEMPNRNLRIEYFE